MASLLKLCTGKDCAKKEHCKRYNVIVTSFTQPYFDPPPYKPDGSCKFYIKNVIPPVKSKKFKG